jgi:hypothetical protein
MQHQLDLAGARAAFAGAAGAGPFHVAVFFGFVGFPEGEVGDGVLVIGVGDGVGDLEFNRTRWRRRGERFCN